MLTPEELKGLNDRELLVECRIAVGILEERTECLYDMTAKVTKLETDMSWIKKVVYGIPTIGVVAATIGGALLKLKDLIS